MQKIITQFILSNKHFQIVEVGVSHKGSQQLRTAINERQVSQHKRGVFIDCYF